MACRCACKSRFVYPYNIAKLNSTKSPYRIVALSSKSPVYEAVRLLGPPARLEASKLKVVMLKDPMNDESGVIPRAYILSHCDFTANLTLSISCIINIDQLRGWYNKDDVIAEWKKLEGQTSLHVHCYVSGPNVLLDFVAEFRYHLFSKEMPLVLEAVLHGDSHLFNKHPELMDSNVWIHFHSNVPKYNRLEFWGTLKDTTKGEPKKSYDIQESSSTKQIFKAIFSILL